MPDVRGWRKKFGVLASSTNTMVEPDFYMMGVPGVTAQISRIYMAPCLRDCLFYSPLSALLFGRARG